VKALSVRQPYAHGIIHGWPDMGIKDVENRSRRTSFRGRLAIHASLGPARDTDYTGDLAKLPRGVIIGTVNIVDCVQGFDSRWSLDGYWHWILADPEPLEHPIPARGTLGLWEWNS
jgi:hypothetical protein